MMETVRYAPIIACLSCASLPLPPRIFFSLTFPYLFPLSAPSHRRPELTACWHLDEADVLHPRVVLLVPAIVVHKVVPHAVLPAQRGLASIEHVGGA